MRNTEKCRYKYSYKEDTINPILFHRNLSCVSTVSTIDRESVQAIKYNATSTSKRTVPDVARKRNDTVRGPRDSQSQECDVWQNSV